MLFHGLGRSGHLYVDCGIDKRMEDLASDELSRITYRLSTQKIAKLSDALAISADLHLGVMLDIKVTTSSNEFLNNISESLNRNGMVFSAVTLGVPPRVEELLRRVAFFPMSEEDYWRVLNGEAVNLRRRYFFEWGSWIAEEAVRLILRARGLGYLRNLLKEYEPNCQPQ